METRWNNGQGTLSSSHQVWYGREDASILTMDDSVRWLSLHGRARKLMSFLVIWALITILSLNKSSYFSYRMFLNLTLEQRVKYMTYRGGLEGRKKRS